MKNLLIHVIRRMKEMRYRMLAVALIGAFGFATYVGSHSAIYSLFQTRDYEYANSNMADFEIVFATEDEINLPSFESMPGVVKSQSRLILPGSVKTKDAKQLSTIFITYDNDNFNKLTLLEGGLFSANDPSQVVIDRNFAISHGYKVGDEIDVRVAKSIYKVKVSGVVKSPEFLITPANYSSFIPTKNSLGVIFCSSKLFENRMGFRLANSFLFDFDQLGDNTELKDSIIKRASERLEIDQKLSQKDQFAYRFLEFDLNAISLFLPPLVIVFIVITSFSLMFLMNQWIRDEGQIIGSLMSLGYGRVRIIAAFLMPALFVLLMILFFGSLLSLAVMVVYADVFADSVGMSEPLHLMNYHYLAKASIGSSFVVLLVTLFPVKRLLALTPIEAVRDLGYNPNLVKDIKTSFLKGVKGPIWFKYAARNLVRKLPISVSTVFVVSLVLSINFALLSSVTSFEEAAKKYLDEDKWDYNIEFFSPIWEEESDEINEIKNINKSIYYIRNLGQYINKDYSQYMLIAAVSFDEDARQLDIVEGRALNSDDKNAVVLEKGFASRNFIKIGDLIDVEVRAKRSQLKVVGTFSGALPHEAYMPIVFAQDFMDLQERHNGLFVYTDEMSDELKEMIYENYNVSRVYSKDEVEKAAIEVIDGAAAMINVTTVMSVAVALLFILSATAFLILQRKNEIGVLSAIGFGKREISYIVVAEIFVLIAFVTLFTLLMGYGLTVLFNSKFSEIWFDVDTVITLKDFVIVVSSAAILFPLAVLYILKEVFKLPLEEVLKQRRFG